MGSSASKSNKPKKFYSGPRNHNALNAAQLASLAALSQVTTTDSNTPDQLNSSLSSYEPSNTYEPLASSMARYSSPNSNAFGRSAVNNVYVPSPGKTERSLINHPIYLPPLDRDPRLQALTSSRAPVRRHKYNPNHHSHHHPYPYDKDYYDDDELHGEPEEELEPEGADKLLQGAGMINAHARGNVSSKSYNRREPLRRQRRAKAAQNGMTRHIMPSSLIGGGGANAAKARRGRSAAAPGLSAASALSHHQQQQLFKRQQDHRYRSHSDCACCFCAHCELAAPDCDHCATTSCNENANTESCLEKDSVAPRALVRAKEYHVPGEERIRVCESDPRAKVSKEETTRQDQNNFGRNNLEPTQERAEHRRIEPLSAAPNNISNLNDHQASTTMAATKQQNGNHMNGASNGTVFCQKMAGIERGLAMDEDERVKNGMLGLLPAVVQDQETQAKAVVNFLDHCKDELSKYVYLRHLKDFNEKLFYYTLTTNVEKLMPLVYTPTVGLACQKFSEIYMRPRGLYVTANDAGRVKKVIANWPAKDVRVIVVTDGERILGLGDLGANGMGISIGKLSLYTALAGIPPQNVLPITIDVGTNNETFLKDPFYIGLRHQRIRGEKYNALIEEFMQAVVERWGKSCLIQFEDFANATAFNLLERYRQQYCTFNDDIQGTASVCLSGLITAAKVTNKRLGDCSFVFYGAGEANLGTANLLVMAMTDEGLAKAEAKRNIWLVDSKGLVTKSRSDLSHHKQEFAQDGPQLKSLEEIIDHIKPTGIIGASAQSGSFTESICKKMAKYNERPIIFALSNPTSKAECTADQAYQWTDGKCVFASGSPFAPVEHKGKTYITGQGNNAYIFPGVGLAAIAAHTHSIPEETFLVAARALSDKVTSSDTSVGLVYPRLSKIRDVTLAVATRVLEYLFAERLATYRPEPSDKLEFLKTIQYDTRY